jgi:hypothetical protein
MFSASVHPCVIRLKLTWQCKTNILSTHSNHSKCYHLSPEYKTFRQSCYFLNRDILFLITCSDR